MFHCNILKSPGHGTSSVGTPITGHIISTTGMPGCNTQSLQTDRSTTCTTCVTTIASASTVPQVKDSGSEKVKFLLLFDQL